MPFSLSLLLIVCVWVLGAAPSFAQDEESVNAEESQKVDELIEGHISALGGEMSLQIESLIAKGQLIYETGAVAQAPQEIEIGYKDGVLVLRMNKNEDGEFAISYGYDDKKQWSKSHDTSRFLNANSFGWMRVLPFVSQQVLHWRDWDAEISALDDSDFDDKEVHQLQIQVNDGNFITHSFSKESGLMIGSVIDMHATQYIVRYKYKEIEGCLCVEELDIEHGNNAAPTVLTYKYKFTEFEFGSEIPNEVFGKPDTEDEDSDDDEDETLEDDDDV